MRSLKDLTDIAGKKILVRVDLNVPVKNGKVEDDFRIRKSQPTLDFLRSHGARLILVSHCEGKESKTLRPMFEYLRLQYPIEFVEKYVDDATREKVAAMKDGDMLLFENLRQYEGEKGNDLAFAASLAGLVDMYVNEAFSASHRSHASIVGVPKLVPSYAGFLLETEVEHLSKAFNPAHPFLFVLGGAKFETKIPLIKKFIDNADTIFVGGALAHNFWKEQGVSIGKSLVSEGEFGLVDLFATKKIMLPQDVVVKRGNETVVTMPTRVLEDDMIVDAGPLSIETLAHEVEKARFVLWNGPLGNFEIGYKEGTLELASRIAETQCESVLGGADTLSAIAALNIEKQFSFVSSGGGAMLDFLGSGTLPGIEALS